MVCPKDSQLEMEKGEKDITTHDACYTCVQYGKDKNGELF